MYPTASASAEDSYVPMGPQAIASGLGTHCSPDEYIAMSSGSISSPLPELPANLEPPPVNRDLKPQRKRKPPDQASGAEEGSKVLEACGKVSFLTLSGKEPSQRAGKYKGKEKWLVLNGKGQGTLLPQLVMIKGVRGLTGTVAL